MGSRMAANLLKNNVDLTIFNRSLEATEHLNKQGATVAKNIHEAVSEADLVFSMLSTPEVVKEVFFGENGGLSKMKSKSTWVDCSTVNPSFSLDALNEAKKYNLHFLDAPVAGTKPHAENAELTFLVGGTSQVFETVKPFMEFMGAKIVHVGDHGKGSSFKMIVNILLAQSMLMFSEATLLGEKMGISKDFLLNVIPNLPVSAPFTKAKAEMIKNEDYTVQFPLEWMHKDLHLAALTAYEVGQPLHLANVTKELFAEANKSGKGRLDFAAIHEYLESK